MPFSYSSLELQTAEGFPLDLFKWTIPDGFDERIKFLIRKRDGLAANEQPREQRSRQDTSTILVSHSPSNDLKELKPEKDLQNYTRLRLLAGLHYCHEATQKQITPRTANFLWLHMDAYKVALETTEDIADESSSLTTRAVVQAFDDVYSTFASSQYRPCEPEEYRILMSLANLRLLEIYNRYSPFAATEEQKEATWTPVKERIDKYGLPGLPPPRG